MKQKYFGSVVFFKHLIFLILIILIMAPWIVIFVQTKKISNLEKRVIELTSIITRLKLKSDTKDHSTYGKNLAKKVAYLTFDDGPSSITDDILNILKEKDVKATFFVTHHNGANAVRCLKRMVKEGHVIGLHSYTHNYDIIYSSVESFMNDIDRLSTYITDNTGYVPRVIRFPGGSNCYKLGLRLFKSLKVELIKRGYVYFDWNVSSADSSSPLPTSDDVVNNCYNGAMSRKLAIILLHDTSVKKKMIVEALPILIDKLRHAGFVFSVLSDDTPQIIFRK